MSGRMPDDGNSESNNQPADQSDSVVFDRYEWHSVDSPSVAIAEAVAAVTNRNVTVLPPLQHALDADALDQLLRSAEETFVRVSFEYADTVVTVRGDGRIEITADGL